MGKLVSLSGVYIFNRSVVRWRLRNRRNYCTSWMFVTGNRVREAPTTSRRKIQITGKVDFLQWNINLMFSLLMVLCCPTVYAMLLWMQIRYFLIETNLSAMVSFIRYDRAQKLEAEFGNQHLIWSKNTAAIFHHEYIYELWSKSVEQWPDRIHSGVCGLSERLSDAILGILWIVRLEFLIVSNVRGNWKNVNRVSRRQNERRKECRELTALLVIWPSHRCPFAQLNTIPFAMVVIVRSSLPHSHVHVINDN